MKLEISIDAKGWDNSTKIEFAKTVKMMARELARSIQSGKVVASKKVNTDA